MKWARISWYGRISGYVATFNQPIPIGPDRSARIPRSHNQYDTFTRIARGRISVGAHPSLQLSAADAIAYYNTLPTLARVKAHEDNYGIWIDGWIRPWGLIRHGFRQPNFSPDWRQWRANLVRGYALELIGLVAIPRGKPRKVKSEWERTAAS